MTATMQPESDTPDEATETFRPSDEDISEHIGNVGVLKRKSKVRAFVDLPGVPEGTQGKVVLVNGWDKWIRYHVLWANGVDMGNIERWSLVPRKQYDEMDAKRRHAIDSGALEQAAADDEADEGDEGGGDAGGGEGATVNGVAIPAHLLARSKAARERLGAA